MRLNNYRGTVADRPIDTLIVQPANTETSQLPVHKPGFMDSVLSLLNSQNNVIPAGNLPVYDKG